MIKRLLDRFFPVICDGQYRWHHFHWQGWVQYERTSGCRRDAYTNDTYKCCRCGEWRETAGPYGSLIRYGR